MSTIEESVMQQVLARLQADPPIVPIAAGVRRSHRTTVTREMAPAVHVIDGDDVPKSAKNDCRTDREKDFVVSIFVRDDEGYVAADPLKIDVNARLQSTQAAPYPAGVTIKQGRITYDQEIADGDALRVDMAYQICYPTPGWALSSDPWGGFDPPSIGLPAAGPLTGAELVTVNQGGSNKVATTQAIAGLGTGGDLSHMVTLDLARLKTIDSPPVELVSAQGVGKRIVPLRCLLLYRMNGSNGLVFPGGLQTEFCEDYLIPPAQAGYYDWIRSIHLNSFNTSTPTANDALRTLGPGAFPVGPLLTVSVTPGQNETGFAVGDTINLAGGALVTVAAVDGNGAITALTITNPGTVVMQTVGLTATIATGSGTANNGANIFLNTTVDNGPDPGPTLEITTFYQLVDV